MPYLPDPPDDPPDEELGPAALQRRVDDVVNMTPAELRRLKDTEAFRTYARNKDAGQPATEPVNDAIQVLEAPTSAFDPGDDVRREAEELLDYVERTTPQGVSGQEIGDSDISRQEMSLLTWGVDPDPDDGFP
jgi:hypothetical protein